jgi:hypothetical protein
MNTLARVVLAAALAATAAGFAPPHSSAAQAQYRQYYGARWYHYPQRGYYYRYYYYKPYPTYTGYKYHYCIYYPRTRYVYYYNPYRRVFWGRYDVEARGYSHLAEEDQRGSLSEIPESAFPQPGAMPAIPESQDGATLEPPPAPPAP